MDLDIKQSLVCTECGKTFTTRSQLESHHKSQTRSRCQKKEGHAMSAPQQKDICTASLVKAGVLKKGVSPKENKRKSLKCRVCDQIFKHESRRQQHEAIHVKDGHLIEELFSTLTPTHAEAYVELVREQKQDRTVVSDVHRLTMSHKRKLKTHLKSCAHTDYFHTCKESHDADTTDQAAPSIGQSKPNILLEFQVKGRHRNVDKSVKMLKESRKALGKTKCNTCEVCGKVFARSANVMLHMRLHRGEKPFTCSTCGKQFRRSDHLKNHELVHAKEEPYQCSLCNERFRRKDHLKYHHINCHGAKIYLSDLKSYTRTAQSEMQNKFILCDVCGVSFGSERKLKNHLRIHSNQGKFSCQYCGKTFNQSSNLNIHLRKHTGETPYKCFSCDQSFTTSSKLKTHARKHTGDLPFTCEICGRLFGESHLLKMHMRIHNDQKSYKCSHCNKTFTHSSTLRAHVRTHTGAKPYKCDQCGDSFAQISSLTYHKRTHSGEKPYSCHVCGNSYTRMATLNIHLTRHTGEKRVSCPNCDFKCDTPKHLRKHAAQVHNHLKDGVSLILEENRSQASDALYPGTLTSSVACPTIANSAGLMSTGNQSNNQAQGQPSQNPALLNAEHSMNRLGALPVLNSCTSSVTPNNVEPVAVHNSVMSTISQGRLSSSNIVNTYSASNTPYVYGLIVGFPDIPKNTDACVLASASVDSNQHNSTSSFLTMLHNSAPCVGSIQLGFDNAAYCLTANSMPQKIPASIAQMRPNIQSASPYLGPTTSMHDSTFCVGVHYSPANIHTLSGHPLPCLPDGQQSLEMPQQTHQDVLSETLPVADVPESYKTVGSGEHSQWVQHPENGLTRMEQKEVFTDQFAFVGRHLNDSSSDGNVTLMNENSLKEEKGNEKHNSEGDKMEEDDEESATDAREEEETISLAYETKLKKTVLPRRKTSRVIQSKPGASNYGQKPNYHQSSTLAGSCTKLKGIHLVKQKPKLAGSYTKLKGIHLAKQKPKIPPDSTLKSKDSPKLRKKRVGKKQGPVECNVCSQTFSRTGNLTTHMRLHSGERPYACKICDKRYTRSDHLKTHMLLHKGDSSLVCNHCGDVFSNTDQLNTHIIDKHEGKKPFACNLCKFSCICLRELKDHVRGHDIKESFRCDICEISYLKVKDLKKHMESHDEHSPFICYVCEKSFKESSCLKLHIMTKHTGEKHFKCGVCEDTYVTAAKLQRHMRNHSGTLPYACEFCGKMFIDTCLLKMHVRIHTNEKPFKCKHCGQNFTHRSTLRAHVRIHTGIKPYTCDICAASFAQVSSLTYHKRRHNGIKPYTCHICGNSYTRSTTLHIHMTRHTGQKRVSCPHCVFKCDMPKHLRKHLAKVHSGAEKVKEGGHEPKQQDEDLTKDKQHQPKQKSDDSSENSHQEAQKQFQPLQAPQILFLPQLHHQFQRGFMVAESFQQPQHLMIQQLHNQPHLPIQQIRPVPLIPHQQQHQPQQQTYESTPDFISVIASNSA